MFSLTIKLYYVFVMHYFRRFLWIDRFAFALHISYFMQGLKSSYNEMKLGQTSMRGQLEEAREQFTMLDVEHTKAVNRCEVLATLNMSLEEDRKNLMSQVRCSE